MTQRPTYTPDRDLNWLDRFAPAARANALGLFAAIEHIAACCTDADMRTVAQNACDKVFEWSLAADEPTSISELTDEEINDLMGRQVWNPPQEN